LKNNTFFLYRVKQAILETRQRAGIGYDTQIAELMKLDDSQLSFRLSTVVEVRTLLNNL
jgi:hypothetical protein